MSAFSGASGSPLRRGDVADDGFQNLGHADPRLRRSEHGVVRVEADDVLDLLDGLLGFGARQVDLVEDGDEFEVVGDGEVGVRQRLRLDALRGIDDEERALARRERARDLVREIDVARRVDEVEDVLLARRSRGSRGGRRAP